MPDNTLTAAGSPRRLFSCLAITALFALALLLYITSCAPGVYLGDCAELMTGAYFLTFVHAPGYPLYLLLGKLFAYLPVGDVAFRLNLMSAFFGAATVALLALFCWRLYRHLPAALLAALAFALSFTFREQANVAEVYTLNTFFLALLLNVALGWQRAAPRDRRSHILLFALLFALALGGHVNPVFLIPAFTLFAVLGGFRPQREPGTVFWMLLLVAAGLALYLYLPIRSLGNPPVINWLKTDTPEKIWSVLSAERFRGQMFAFTPAQVGRNALEGVILLVVQFPLVGFLLGGAGLRALWQFDRAWAWFVGVAGGTIFLYTINYDIVDRGVYYLPLYLVFTIPLAAALRDLWKLGRTPVLRLLLMAALLLPYPLAAQLVHPESDRSQHWLWPDYADAFANLPPHSAVIAYWPHYTVLRYAQLVEGRRPDIRLVENSSLTDRRYLDDIQRHSQYGPLYFTLETALVGTEHQLVQEGFFFRVAPPAPVAPVTDSAALNWQTAAGGLEYAVAQAPPAMAPRALVPVDLRWRLAPDPPATVASSDPTREYTLLLVDQEQHAIARQRLLPVDAGFPPGKWQPGAVYPQRRWFYLPASLPTGEPLAWLIR